MSIDDSQFNLMFSVRAMSSLIFPFMLPWCLEKCGTRCTLYFLTLCAVVGQRLFILGLHQKNYFYCLLSRFIFGISDLQTIMQNVIMCIWFTNEELPVAFSMILFMVKLVRAINDNVASMVYNHYRDIEIFFQIGSCVCVFSLLATVVLVEVHCFYIESGKNKRRPVKDGNKKSKTGQSARPKTSIFSTQVIIILVLYLVCNSTLHSFYPNFSKFLQ